MKKSNKKAITILIITTVILVICTLIIHFVPRTSDLSFADTIVITDNWASGGAKSIEINKEADKKNFNELIKLCSCDKSENIIKFETPACMFEEYEIEFRSGNKTITVIPSNDDCDTVLMKIGKTKKYYNIAHYNKQELNKILESLMQ